MTKHLTMVSPTPDHLAAIWANLAADDAHALSAGLVPPAGPEDLAAWSGQALNCITSGVVLLDERPIGYVGINADPAHGYLIPWGVTVQHMGLSKQQAMHACIKVWQALCARVDAVLGVDGKANYVSYLNFAPTSHKRARALLPLLGFAFTGEYWTSPAGTQFEFFKAPACV